MRHYLSRRAAVSYYDLSWRKAWSFRRHMQRREFIPFSAARLLCDHWLRGRRANQKVLRNSVSPDLKCEAWLA